MIYNLSGFWFMVDISIFCVLSFIICKRQHISDKMTTGYLMPHFLKWQAMDLLDRRSSSAFIVGLRHQVCPLGPFSLAPIKLLWLRQRSANAPSALCLFSFSGIIILDEANVILFDQLILLHPELRR